MDMITIPSRPPHEDGRWHNEDLDDYDFPDHTEIIEGQLIMMAAQRSRHADIIDAVKAQLGRQIPPDVIVQREMAILIDKHNVPEPDVLVVKSQPDYGPDTTRYRVEDVLLAVEVESPSTDLDDRYRKPALYAKAGIGHYLRVSEHPDTKVLHLHYYRLDGNSYTEVTSWPTHLEITDPWPVTLDLSRA